LETLDDLLSVHREKLASLTTKEAQSSSTTSDRKRPSAKKPDYKDLDLTKAKRLIQAREAAIKSVKALIAKKSNPS